MAWRGSNGVLLFTRRRPARVETAWRRDHTGQSIVVRKTLSLTGNGLGKAQRQTVLLLWPGSVWRSRRRPSVWRRRMLPSATFLDLGRQNLDPMLVLSLCSCDSTMSTCREAASPMVPSANVKFAFKNSLLRMKQFKGKRFMSSEEPKIRPHPSFVAVGVASMFCLVMAGIYTVPGTIRSIKSLTK
ncbi:hypothetical protein EJB05_01032, partial [Eragrostis curvula]